MNARRIRLLALAVLAAVATVAACTPPPPTPSPGAPALSVTSVVSGLAHPWDVAFTPDGTMLVTERPGRINAIVDGAARVLAAPSDVRSMSEGGMLGIAVDPGFATNRRIYACFLSNAGGSLDVRVARWTVDNGYSSLSGRADILTGLPVNASGQAGRHSGCRLAFGPDGALWVTTGDAARTDTSQNPRSLGGKVLRITTTGAAAPGNPGGSLDPRIFSLGHRNVQGISFRPGDGRAFTIEQGTNCDDEVNLPVAGANFGWNPGARGFYDESAPMTDTASVPGAVAAVWRSGCPTIATSGGSFISSPRWGSWNGALAVAALAGRQLRVVQFSGGSAPTVVRQWTALTDRGRLRTVTQGPDGDLYVPVDSSNGSVLRLSPTAAA